MISSDYVWAKVLSHMEDRLGPVHISAWFDDAKVIELNEEHLILYSPRISGGISSAAAVLNISRTR